MNIFLKYLYSLLLFYAVFVIPMSLIAAEWTSADVSAIRSSILNASSGYHRLIRPSATTNVSVALSILTINSLDTKNQALSSTGWLTMNWVDPRLKWNKSAYPNVTYVFAEESEIWRPEFFIDNSISDVTILSDSKLLYRIKYNGDVEWELPRIFNTHCHVDITYYPFDTQICTITLTSWAYTVEEISLHPTKTSLDTEDIEQNGEWNLLSSSVTVQELTETKHDGSVRYNGALIFSVLLERKTSYYITGILLPVLLMSYLNTFVFILPADSGEKVGFILTVLLSLAVLLTIITDKIPSTSLHVCILSVYLAMTLCFGVICCLLTVVVLKINFRDDTKPVPEWIKAIMKSTCFRFSCWRRCVGHFKQARATKTSNVPSDDIKSQSPNVVQVILKEEMGDGSQTVSTKINSEVTMTSGSENPENISWKDVAVKLDIFFFVTTLVLISLCTLVFLMAITIGSHVSSHKNIH